MSAPNDHVLGVDVGASNSHFCVAAAGVLAPNAIHIDGRASTPTSVLWQRGADGAETVKAFGQAAEDEWGMALPEEKKHWRLSTHFKPDIAVDAAARRDAEAFLRSIGEYLRDHALLPAAARPDELSCLFGVPASPRRGHDEAMRDIARAAGFGVVSTVAEPLGALIHHLARNDIPAREVRRGLLVVDFGGGTCDVSYLLRADVRCAWGDPLLGGRLFDDLFWQWFLAENPGAGDALRAAGEEYYVHWIKCREMKERFSETMARNRGAVFRFNLPPHGALRNATWAAFEERARHYTPTPQLRPLLDGGEAPSRFGDGEVDLLGWFAEVVGRGIESAKVRVEDVSWVILTGGSSAWPFVRDAVTAALQVEPERLIQSANPRGAVGEGIALLPVLREKHRRAVVEIKREQPRKNREITAAAMRAAREFADTLCADLADRLLDTRIVPRLETFRQDGGTLRELERDIDQAVAEFEAEARDLIRERTPELRAQTRRRIVDILGAWFGARGIRWEPGYLDDVAFDAVAFDREALTVDDPYFSAIATVVSVVVGAVAGSLCGGSGIALIAAGPAGLAAGALLGLFVGAAALFLGRDAVERFTRTRRIYPWLSGWVLRQSKLQALVDDARETMRDNLRAAVLRRLDERSDALRASVADLVARQVDDLSVLDHIGGEAGRQGGTNGGYRLQEEEAS